MVCSKVFLLLGLAGAHHHPSVWHAGDNTPEQADQKMDWGIFQLIAVGLRPTVDNNLFLTSISFGRHALHHMFPTIDHAYLNLLNPTFEQTCRDFGILDLFPLPIEKASPWAKRRYLSLYEGWIGMIRQVSYSLIYSIYFEPNRL
jgi:fatty acid desaturase